ncbi:MAG: ABC transporter substrate-binding protein, partial [Mesorhizobium sp.]
SWATIHPGFLSAYANFDQKDLNVSADGKLSAAMNTAESKAFHKQWVQMIQESGPKDWSTYTWYQVGTDLGAGASAMIFDADILGYFMNGGDNKMAGKLAFSAFKA